MVTLSHFSPRFTNLESENSRAMERAAAEEKKITELEEELRVVGSNLQQLEVDLKKNSKNKIKIRRKKVNICCLNQVSEEKALQREETYQRQIYELLHR